ncbi:single-stranded DNA-binding protein [Seleniivibrio woodruffii]|uniref:Single-stranded DNA-binding protein n=1 Tax=Seleniivibrio woodruffii TaxID=1078050 RepID=A0A4R1K2Y7_9BACT|nr:single-stranded DNA-binding protein [Seleniivibrio woodruffii]TCK58418.1 single-strand binding protein [Seleniivibrio woodruffii]TVZ36791.1 single-strand DNA-binding protein [Seleniivibrio woodruffii]
MNIVILKGNITKEPEIRTLPNGTLVAEASVAVTKKYRDKNGELKEETSFFDIRTFGYRAEFVKNFVSKGSPVLIEGKLKQDKWESEGKNRYRVLVVANSIQLLAWKKQSDDMPPHTPEEDSDDIPF